MNALEIRVFANTGGGQQDVDEVSLQRLDDLTRRRLFDVSTRKPVEAHRFQNLALDILSGFGSKKRVLVNLDGDPHG